MSAVRAFTPVEIGFALIVATSVQLGSFAMLRAARGVVVRADVSDDRAKPMAVAITPIVADLPLLKLGSRPDPRKLPDMWRAPVPTPRVAEVAAPTKAAAATPEAIPTAKVSDAGATPPPPDAAVARSVDVPIAGSAATASPNVPGEGAPDGVKEGTETDPLKAHAVSLYRGQLDAWFSSRFAIRGKIPFDELKTLRASVTVNVGAARNVASFSIAQPSGNAVFDATLRAALASIQSSGAELPPPPPMYPDVLGQTLRLSFACTQKSRCE